MAPMTLPQAEIDRIDKEADAIFNPKDLPICTPEIAHHLGELCSAYTAGAIHEAERGREQMARFAEWVDDNDFRQKSKGIWENLNGTSRTTAELLDLFLDTQKKKG